MPSTQKRAHRCSAGRNTPHRTLRPWDKARLAASVLYVGERFNGANRADLLDDYLRVDLTGSYVLYDNAEVFLRVENLTDEQYEEIQAIPAPLAAPPMQVCVRGSRLAGC